MNFLKIFLTSAVIITLSGCAMMGGSDDSDKKPEKPIPQNCNQWCHNGWCSTHCDPVITGS